MSEDTEVIVTPEWLAGVRSNWGLDKWTPTEAARVWEHRHLPLAGIVCALGHALNHVDTLRAERDAAITAREAAEAVVEAAVAMEAMVSVTEWSRDPNGYSTVTMRERPGFELHLALCRLLDAARAHATDAGGWGVSAHTAWTRTRLRVGTRTRKGTLSLADVLVSESVPGLCVRVGMMVDTSYKGRTLPIWGGAEVVTINHGHRVGPVLHGEALGMALAAAIANVFPWATYDGNANSPSGDETVKAIVDALEPIKAQSDAKHAEFLAAHAAKESTEPTP